MPSNSTFFLLIISDLSLWVEGLVLLWRSAAHVYPLSLRICKQFSTQRLNFLHFLEVGGINSLTSRLPIVKPENPAQTCQCTMLLPWRGYNVHSTEHAGNSEFILHHRVGVKAIVGRGRGHSLISCFNKEKYEGRENAPRRPHFSPRLHFFTNSLKQFHICLPVQDHSLWMCLSVFSTITNIKDDHLTKRNVLFWLKFWHTPIRDLRQTERKRGWRVCLKKKVSHFMSRGTNKQTNKEGFLSSQISHWFKDFLWVPTQ